MSHLELGAGAEFDRIRAIARALGSRASALGDDCALIPMSDGVLAMSSDISLEGVHFRREWLSFEEIGWRATAAALSDLAAEGALPIGVLATLTIPPSSGDDDAAAVMHGVGAAAEAVGGRVLGGDLSAGPVWSVGITVVGHTRQPVTRAGARPGDGIWVTGELGAARAALESLQAGADPGPGARAAFAHPVARVAAGWWLARHGAHAMLDVSDGLVADARHLAAASRVRVALELDRLPVSPDARAAALAAGAAPERYAAEGGEDYELLVALPSGSDELTARDFGEELGLPLTRVGRVEAGAGVVATLGGEVLTVSGFDHFA